ncbi:MAG: sugar phosphate nucleotidyltransferase [Christensenellales bacterium]|jgi:glucose-1-phosphate thymidylyltransferase
MICLILAAGYATRLYPLTENFPKPLLEVGGRSILDWLVGDIDASGAVSRYAVVSNRKFADPFRKWAAGASFSALVTVLDDGSTSNETRLGAVRDIQFAIDAMKLREDLLVVAGDNLLDFSLGAFIDYARDADACCLMRYRERDVNRLKKCGVMEIGAGDRVLRMEEKPEAPFSEWCAPPFYYYPARHLPLIGEAIASGAHVDAPGSLMAWMAQKTEVRAMEMPGKRYDIGDLESYRRVCAAYRGMEGERV